MEHSKTNTSKSTLKIGHILNHFLEIKSTKRTLVDIFFWWEGKRLHFNLIVLAICFLCYAFQEVISNSTFTFSKEEIVLFIILYNICYSTFCVIEFFIPKNRQYAPKAFKNGLFVCAAVLSIPTVFHTLENLIF